MIKKLTVMFTVSLFAISTNSKEPDYQEYKYPKEKLQEVTVAVIDSGINTGLDIFDGIIWKNTKEIPNNNLDDDNNGYVDDVYGWDFYNNDNILFHNNSFFGEDGGFVYEEDHGTGVASVIAQVKDYVPLKIMMLKCNGGRSGNGQTESAVKAIKYAEQNGAQICNISWGTYEHDPELYEVIKSSSMLFVCAAGNDGTDNDLRPLYPAGYELDNVISVACLDKKAGLSDGANYGLNTVDIGMFGENVYCYRVHGQEYRSGSSFAAARVTGMATLIYAFHSGFHADVVKNDILCKEIVKADNLVGNIKHPGYPAVNKIYNKLVSYENELNYNPVKPKENNVTGILLNVTDVTLKKNEMFSVVYKCFPLGVQQNVEFFSLNSNVAKVDSFGNINAVGRGDTYITITCGRLQKTVSVHVY